MANMEHVQLVKRGRDVVARWREQNPNDVLDLNAAYMSFARAPQVNISGADLRNADLMGAVLQRANLSGCHLNPCHLYHANLREADLTRARLNGANLRGTNLSGADLSGADLDRATLSDANLSGAKLVNANLSRANLTGADLTDADLTGASFEGATLARTDLTNAVFKDSDFFQAQFRNANFSGAQLAGCSLGYTVFQDCDLRLAQGLDHVRHDAPSTVGLDTIYRSGGEISVPFLIGVGLPVSVAAVQTAISGEPSILGDCFIACSDKDDEFAQALKSDLQTRGVRCWVFSERVRGNPLVNRHSTSDQEEVERWVRYYRKMIVVGSTAGLDTEAILNDITQAKERQQSTDRWVLFLVSPDDGLVKPASRSARNLVAEHVVFDLRGYRYDRQAYAAEIERLAEALKQDQPASVGVPAHDGQL